MQQLLSDSVVLLSPHAVLRSDRGYVLDLPETAYRFNPVGGRIVTDVLPHLDGSETIADIEHRLGLDSGLLAEVLGTLESADLANITAMLHANSAAEFLDQYYPLCDHWGRQVFACPFWEDMLSGRASRTHVLGWGVEFYHRTLGADEHNEKSVRHCQDAQVREWLTDHFKEELGHGEMFLHGLVESGLSADDVLRSTPLGSTRSLIEFFNALAERDSIAYLGCYGVMHSPRVGQTAKRVNEQYDMLVSHYPFAAGILNAIRQHALLDIDLGHDEITLEKLAQRDGWFSPDVALRILKAAHGTARMFDEYFAGIQQYYGRPDAQLLRPA